MQSVMQSEKEQQFTLSYDSLNFSVDPLLVSAALYIFHTCANDNKKVKRINNW